MAVPTLLQVASFGDRFFSGSATFPGACTPGSTLLAFLSQRSANFTSVSDGTNTWARETDGTNPIVYVDGNTWCVELWRAENSSSSALSVNPAPDNDFNDCILMEWDGLDAVVDWATYDDDVDPVSFSVGSSPGDDHLGLSLIRASFGAGFAVASGHTLARDIEPVGGGTIAAIASYQERDSGQSFTAEADINEGDNFAIGLGVLYSPADVVLPPTPHLRGIVRSGLRLA